MVSLFDFIRSYSSYTIIRPRKPRRKMEVKPYGEFLTKMLEDIRLRPIDPFFRIEHLADEEAMMLVEHFRRVVSIFTDPMRVIDILPDEIKNPSQQKIQRNGER